LWMLREAPALCRAGAGVCVCGGGGGRGGGGGGGGAARPPRSTTAVGQQRHS
jgi:hypothetical protein